MFQNWSMKCPVLFSCKTSTNEQVNPKTKKSCSNQCYLIISIYEIMQLCLNTAYTFSHHTSIWSPPSCVLYSLCWIHFVRILFTPPRHTVIPSVINFDNQPIPIILVFLLGNGICSSSISIFSNNVLT